MKKTCGVLTVCPLAMLWAMSAAAATPCESLTSLTLPNTTITLAMSVAAGAFTPEKSAAGIPTPPPVPPYTKLPAFCRVAVSVKPVADSDIRFELWMPASGWNGKFVGVGNGGYSGEIWYWAMTEPLARGYATASTDTGHRGSVVDASFAAGHPEKWTDFAYRAVHEMTVKSKAIIAAFYGNPTRRAYWNGCSTGGRQGLMEAQRYPEDYDGIIAGAPANYMSRLSAQFIWVSQALHKEPGSFIPPDKLQVLHSGVVNACDARDGVKDGILENPASCKFDPAVLACKGPDTSSCLTPPQVEAARQIYGGSVNPRTKQVLFPGLAPGAELGWSTGVGQVMKEPIPLVTGIFKFVVFNDPAWDYRNYDFDKDDERARQASRSIDALDANLKKFFDRGGKLLQYHGWADPGIPPQNSIDYYDGVLAVHGGASKVNDSYRLFMVPGMDHCGGGEGPDRFDALSALDTWVEKKQPPNQILASRTRDGTVDRTRPLCPYPQVAVYKGSGSTDDAMNFTCRVP
jgi:pimeloyl-ACP methyl ester carboxylesterase